VDEQRFFAVPGFANAAYVIGFLALAAAVGAALLSAGTTGALFSVAFGVIALLVLGLARFTKTTPILVLRERELVARAAMLAPERRIPYAFLKGFSVSDGYVVLVPIGDAVPVRIPMTSFTEADARAMLTALEARLSKV
jgi:hypothetical protein